jgi:uncharacterized membrane protein
MTTVSSPPPAGRPSRKRAVFIDILKLIVALQMMNGHTLNEFLLPSLQTGEFFYHYTHFRGLVSVGFLVCAGFSFHLATLARFAEHRATPGAHRKRFVRALILVALGYILRFSNTIWSTKPYYAHEAYLNFIRADALQCIGLTLLLLEAMTAIARHPRQVALGATCLAIAATAGAPLVDPAVATEGPWLFLTAFLTHQFGSLFPIAPWSGFMLGGVALGYLTFGNGQANTVQARIRLSFAAIAIFGLGYMTLLPGFPRPPAGYHPGASPGHVLYKMGEILLALSVLSWLSFRVVRLPKVLSILASETLTLYIVHLAILYRWPIALVSLIGPRSMTILQGLAASALVVTLTILITLAKHAAWPHLLNLKTTARSIKTV